MAMEKKIPEVVELFGLSLSIFHLSRRRHPNYDPNRVTKEELSTFLLTQFHFSDDAREASKMAKSIVVAVHPHDVATICAAPYRSFHLDVLNRVYTLSKLVSGNYDNFEDFCDAAEAWAQDPQVMQLFDERYAFHVLLRTILEKLQHPCSLNQSDE